MLIDEVDQARADPGGGELVARAAVVRHRHVAKVLRYVDPDAAETTARASREPGGVLAGAVRVSDVLLDRGQWQQAIEVLTDAHDPEPSPIQAAIVRAAAAANRAHANTLAGLYDQARIELAEAFAQHLTTGAPPLMPTLVLADLERATGRPEAVIEAIDHVLRALPDSARTHRNVVALRWRRASCQRQLLQAIHPAGELLSCRNLLADDELYGPRELLGLLVEQAQQLALDDSAAAARLMGTVDAHRGSWVLPFSMDIDADALRTRLLPRLHADWEAGRLLEPSASSW